MTDKERLELVIKLSEKMGIGVFCKRCKETIRDNIREHLETCSDQTKKL